MESRISYSKNEACKLPNRGEFGAGDGTRTRDVQLGKLGHGSRLVVPGTLGSASLSCYLRGQGFIAAAGMKRAEKVGVHCERASVAAPSSIGGRGN